MKIATSYKSPILLSPILHQQFQGQAATDGSNSEPGVRTHGIHLCCNTDYFLIGTIFVTLTALVGGRWVLLWVQGGGITNYIWPQSRDKYVWDSTFSSALSLTAFLFQMRSVWAGQSGGPVCLTAEMRM